MKLISAFVFPTRVRQSLYLINTKFQASSHLVLLYSLLCVRPGRKPRRPVFSEQGSNKFTDKSQTEPYHKMCLQTLCPRRLKPACSDTEATWTEVKVFSCSTQLSLNFILLINVKKPTIGFVDLNLKFPMILAFSIFMSSLIFTL